MQKPFLLIFFSGLLIACSSTKNTQEETVVGPFGQQAMVSTAHPLATKVGVRILREGGNAFDAAAAVKFALAVVFPRAGNLGGGGFAVYRQSSGEAGSLDFREKAPLSAKRDMYLDQTGNVLTEKSREGHQAAGVPGSVDGILKLHEKYGAMTRQQIIQPAIELAYYGFAITQDQADELNLKKDILTKYNGPDFFLVKEEGWKAGDSIRFRELAGTLTQIRDLGRKGFYDGIVADQIVKEMRRGNGLISLSDLEQYQSKWRNPLIGTYKGHEIISMPPPSSGGVALLQLLQGAEMYNIKKSGHNTAETIHLLTELERRVYADRATHLGDPDFYPVPLEMLLDQKYNQDRFSDISTREKTNSQKIKEGNVKVIESMETTHFSIVDSARNAVSITTTLNGFFGCKVYVRGAGFFLNNEMDDFSAKPGVPNQFGLVGGEANSIEAEKRMLSSMTPTIVAQDDQLKMVIGTPGGSTIITAVFQTILNVIDHEMTMQEAVNAKKTHSQWLPDEVYIEENAIHESTLKRLEKMGHTIISVPKIGR
ncbi:MAG: gamma-glutamyltransferase, partial [Bacteroidota bacterium]